VGPDGRPQIDRLGLPRHLGDLYHRFLVLPWGWWFLVVGCAYVLINAAFALVWLAVPGSLANARPGHFGDAFAFSVQTFATIGYGAISPVGTYANFWVTVESLVGLIFQALVTGIAFAKFSRPTARVRFSKHVVLLTYDGKPSLMVRTANERANQIVEATLRLTLLVDEVTKEGEHIRRLKELPLVRGSTPFFALSWNAVHVIDEKSPLFGETRESLAAKQAQLIAVLIGIDDTFHQTIHARAAWRWDEIRWGERFVDILRFREDESRVIDYSYFDETEPESSPRERRPRART
jgi:inward rectifier potassium channel